MTDEMMQEQALQYIAKGEFPKSGFTSENWKIRLVTGFVNGYPIEALLDEKELIVERALSQFKKLDSLTLV